MYVIKIVKTTIYAHGCPYNFKDYVGCTPAAKRYGTIAYEQLKQKKDISVNVVFRDEARSVVIPYKAIDYAVITERIMQLKESEI